MDRIDYEILSQLQNNARIANKVLAARVGLAPSSCMERVRRLREAGALGAAHQSISRAASERGRASGNEGSRPSHHTTRALLFSPRSVHVSVRQRERERERESNPLSFFFPQFLSILLQGCCQKRRKGGLCLLALCVARP